jgi:DNA-binding transcriptional MerR regulator
MSDTLTSSQAAADLKIPSETLRYWERAGLLDPVGRDAGRRRQYSAGDLEFIDVVKCLRATGMPIRDVRRFTELVRRGPESVPDRLALLRAHRDAVLASLDEQRAALAHVTDKIARYEAMG